MSAIVLAGGVSRRFGQDKSLVMLGEKPLVVHVLDRVANVVDETVVVVNSEIQKQNFAKVIGEKTRVVVDEAKVQTPLAGALAGFVNVQNEYTLLLGCDTPFLSSEILIFLLEVCLNKAAAIPRWPNGNIEPLQAAYRTEIAAQAAETAIKKRQLDMRSMIKHMKSIRYISTSLLHQLDPKLKTFFNINTPKDLEQAEAMIQQRHAY
ncbi:MAG: molybdenum cofactor guanylyltransferase [Candidatus Bathyarchaeia archaeon]